MRYLLPFLLILLLAGCGDGTVVGDNQAAAKARTAPAEEHRAHDALMESRFGGKGKDGR